MATGLFNLKQVNQAIRQNAWPNSAPKWVEYLCVAGGGAGGGGAAYSGGGGGAGGLLSGMFPITVGSSYTVTIGGGGTGSAGHGTSGVDSSVGPIISKGGGGGSYGYSDPGLDGGSGGGGGASYTITVANKPSQGVPGQGYGGGANFGTSGNGAGGGAGAPGGSSPSATGFTGGSGIASAISGTFTTYAGGGASGSTYASGLFAAVGGAGGGGSGAYYNGVTATVATAGQPNTGGGGGGASNGTTTAGNGGTGIVIIRYPGTTQFFTGGTLSYANGYMIHTFYANGTLAPTTPTLYANPDYQISRSLRFNSADTAYLNWTPSNSATSTQRLTYSCWVKRSTLGAYSHFGLSSAVSGSSRDAIRFNSDDTVNIYLNEGASFSVATTAVFRDVSAWYHIVVAVDTTQVTSASRIRLYVNNVEQTLTGTQPTQNYIFTGWLVSGKEQDIGRNPQNAYFFGGYETEINCIDGQQLTPSSFGWTNPATGVWAPLKFVGTYGTNGFYLKFADNSNTTAATLGVDSSGNGNNWTPNNFSVTAGVTNDSFVDTPTPYGTDTGAGGEVRGNYCTWNPTIKAYATHTYSDGNLVVTGPADWGTAQGTFGVTSGKWYWEVVSGNADVFIGVSGSNMNLAAASTFDATGAIMYNGNGTKSIDGTDTSYGATYTTETIGVALDMTGGTVTFYKNNVSQGSINLSTSTLNGYTILPIVIKNGSTATANFGQRAFAYTAPSGYKALCTQNLPTPTIGATADTQANKYFNTVLWTGNNANPRTIGGVGFQPDFVWIKKRSATSAHYLHDVVRGVTDTDSRTLVTNAVDAETNYYTSNGMLNAFVSDGFRIAGGGTNLNINASNETQVAWNWKAGGTAVTNTSGSITSSVSASPTSGFSIVTYTGTGAGGTIGHGIGTTLSMVIIKRRNTSASDSSWMVGHVGVVMGTGRMILNGTDVNNAGAGASLWNSTAATSTVFSVGNYTSVNESASTYVAYCFAPIAGYSAFGTYTGNGAVDGPFVHTGFRPRFILIRKYDVATDWQIIDTARDTYNAAGQLVEPNATNAESDARPVLDILSNGFKLRYSYSTTNQSGSSFIYAAFAETPFKYSLAR